VTLGAAATAAAFLFELPGLDRSAIFYYPYPALSMPRFDFGLALATVGLLGPALWQARQPAPAEAPAGHTASEPGPPAARISEEPS
jgi:hypothetical protein